MGIDIEQAGAILHVPPSVIWRLAKAGLLTHSKNPITGRVMFDRIEVQLMANANARGAAGIAS